MRHRMKAGLTRKLDIATGWPCIGVLVFAMGMQFSSAAEVTTDCVFSSNMVVQRNAQVPVWGWADPAQRIQVTCAGQTVSATADGEGRWRAVLSPMSVGGPYTMVVTGGTTTLTYTNIMVGDVWICSGQSNMEITFDMPSPYGDITQAPKDDVPDLRLFHISFNFSHRNPVEDIKTVDSLLESGDRTGGAKGNYRANKPWRPMTALNARRSTAVGYYFGRKLQTTLKIPIGLIDNSAGGSKCNQWFSPMSAAANKTSFTLQDTTDLKILKYTNEVLSNQLDNYGAYYPGIYYYGHIFPIMGFPVAGVIWWQGESDCHFGYNSNYGNEFVETIKQWRYGPAYLSTPPAGTPQRVLDILGYWKKGFGIGDFPFIYFALQAGCDTAGFHKMQRQALALPKVAEISVVGPSGDHPAFSYRKPIGEAFADKALAMLASESRGNLERPPLKASSAFNARALPSNRCRVTGLLRNAGPVGISLIDLSGRRIATCFGGIRAAGLLDIVFQLPRSVPRTGILSLSVGGAEVATMTATLAPLYTNVP